MFDEEVKDGGAVTSAKRRDRPITPTAPTAPTASAGASAGASRFRLLPIDGTLGPRDFLELAGDSTRGSFLESKRAPSFAYGVELASFIVVAVAVAVAVVVVVVVVVAAAAAAAVAGATVHLLNELRVSLAEGNCFSSSVEMDVGSFVAEEYPLLFFLFG